MSPRYSSVPSVPVRAAALPQVALLATGGTIAGVAASPLEQIDYAAGVLGVERMLESLPGIEGVARILRRQCANLPSENCTPTHWALLARGCAEALADPETCGVVLTHGTDTLEESAFYLYLTLPPAKPVVLTGAMRPATSLSADGPINIRDAVAVAASPAARNRGALLVMNGRILSARTAVKVATVDVEAFAAPESGGLGRTVNGQPLFFADSGGAAPLAGAYAALAGEPALPRVDVLYACAGMAADLARYSAEHAQGLVLAGMGNGSMPAEVRDLLRQAAARGLVVVRASRTGAGPVTPLPDYAPFIPAGMLSPAKARVLLMLSLAAAATLPPDQRQAAAAAAFAQGGRL
ncbi:asparaginase [Desulfovibrio legallii]|uniref:Asparaginase n=1 Tax=Desulfovibrio legallii TaxID=571438 RepID=A0A1G7LVX1_9BACT|nr:asparaginase [Desulfovibrio legallii]SDF53571.1 asparaginase [Desulfovibrio legallii]